MQSERKRDIENDAHIFFLAEATRMMELLTETQKTKEGVGFMEKVKNP